MSEGKKRQVEMLTITGATALDPIDVIFEDFGPGAGQVLIRCYGECWSAYWGAMGKDTLVADFFTGCDESYLSGCMGPQSKKDKYVQRICKAIKDYLKDAE